MIDQLKYMLVGFFDKEGYPLARTYWLTQNGLVTAAIIISAYLLFATVLGPLWMRNRQPYTSLRPFILTYNFFMSFANLYFFFRYLSLLKFGAELRNFKVPDPVEEASNPEALARINTLYLYLITKYLDLFDTIFFVLRKKTSHVSFLHLYHHSSVAFLGIMNLNFFIRSTKNNPVPFFLGTLLFLMYPSCSPIGLFTMLNSAIHVVMYFYYALSSLPGMSKYLWWKKYITQIQIVQFIIYLFYYSAFAMYHEGYNNFLMYNFGITQSPLYLFLFCRFYYQTYYKKKSNSTKLQHSDDLKCNENKMNGELRKRTNITYATLSQS